MIVWWILTAVFLFFVFLMQLKQAKSLSKEWAEAANHLGCDHNMTFGAGQISGVYKKETIYVDIVSKAYSGL